MSTYLTGSISVVIDDVVFPAWPESGLEAWRKRLPSRDLDMVVLMPSWDIIVSRNVQRSGRDNLPVPMLRTIFDDMQAWQRQSEFPVIDNSKLSTPRTVERAGCLLGY